MLNRDSLPPGYDEETKADDDHDFEKKQQECDTELGNYGLCNHKTRVIFVLDISQSMDEVIESGLVDRFVRNASHLANAFDDNGILEIYSFGSTVNPDIVKLDCFDRDQVQNFSVEQNIIEPLRAKKRGALRGGTAYAPVLSKVIDDCYPNSRGKQFQKIPAEQGAFVIFVTDGDCQDKKSAIRAALRSSWCGGLFFKYIALGGQKDSFALLQELDDMQVATDCWCFMFGSRSRSLLDNADFLHLPDAGSIAELQYGALLKEYPTFLKESLQKKLLTGDVGLTENAIERANTSEGRRTGMFG